MAEKKKRKQLSGGAKMKASGKKAILLGVTPEQFDKIKLAASLEMRPVTQFVMFYSVTKRFTTLAHLVLGFSLGIAPAAAWIAMRGSLDPRILWLTAAVTLWTAGFDIIYACQDYDYDSAHGLHSIPRHLGIKNALTIARLFHILMLGLLGLMHLSVVAARKANSTIGPENIPR